MFALSGLLTYDLAKKLPVGTPVILETGNGTNYLKAKCLLTTICSCGCEVQITEIIEQGERRMHIDGDLIDASYHELSIE